jgi:radical SAM superfamily enzyme
MAKDYKEKPFKTLELDEYIARVEEFLVHLRKDIYIERLYAKATHPEECLAPVWSKNHWFTHNRFRDVFEKKKLRQGSHYREQ